MTNLELIKRIERVMSANHYKLVKTNFEQIYNDVCKIQDVANRAEIFKTCVKVLKNKNFNNQFAAAAHFADAVINGSDYFSNLDSYEISGYYTKTGNPVVVAFK